MFERNEPIGGSLEKSAVPEQPEEHIGQPETKYEGILGKVMEVVEKPGHVGVIFVSGYEGIEYDELRTMLKDKEVDLIMEEGAVGLARQAVNEGTKKNVVVLRTNLLEEMFRDSTSALGSEDLAKLSKPTGEPKAELTEWLKHRQESNPDSPVAAAFAEVLQNIRSAGGGRDVELAIKPDSALALALAAFARTGEVTAESVENTTIDPYGPVMIKIVNGTITVDSGGTTIGSRSIN